MVSPDTDDQFIISLRSAEATRDFLHDLARSPVTMSIKDEFVSMWYPNMKAAVDAGYDLKSLCEKIKSRSKYAFAMRDLEELYLKAKADADKGSLQIGKAKRGAPKRAAAVDPASDASKGAAATVTPINAKVAKAEAPANAKPARTDAASRLNASGFDPENDPNDPDVLRNV